MHVNVNTHVGNFGKLRRQDASRRGAAAVVQSSDTHVGVGHLHAHGTADPARRPAQLPDSHSRSSSPPGQIKSMQVDDHTHNCSLRAHVQNNSKRLTRSAQKDEKTSQSTLVSNRRNSLKRNKRADTAGEARPSHQASEQPGEPRWPLLGDSAAHRSATKASSRAGLAHAQELSGIGCKDDAT